MSSVHPERLQIKLELEHYQEPFAQLRELMAGSLTTLAHESPLQRRPRYARGNEHCARNQRNTSRSCTSFSTFLLAATDVACFVALTPPFDCYLIFFALRTAHGGPICCGLFRVLLSCGTGAELSRARDGDLVAPTVLSDPSRRRNLRRVVALVAPNVIDWETEHSLTKTCGRNRRSGGRNCPSGASPRTGSCPSLPCWGLVIPYLVALNLPSQNVAGTFVLALRRCARCGQVATFPTPTLATLRCAAGRMGVVGWPVTLNGSPRLDPVRSHIRSSTDYSTLGPAC